MERRSLRVVLVDPDPMAREGVAALLGAETDIEVVAQFEAAEDLIPAVPALDPDVVVLEVRLAGMSGIDASAILTARHRALRVVIVSGVAGEGPMLTAFASGAKAFVVKESGPESLTFAIRVVMSGWTYVDPRVADRLVVLASRRGAQGPHGLTTQEMRVVAQLSQGLTNRQIAAQLCLSKDTVKTHLRGAMRKLQTNDRAETAAIAIREKLA